MLRGRRRVLAGPGLGALSANPRNYFRTFLMLTSCQDGDIRRWLFGADASTLRPPVLDVSRYHPITHESSETTQHDKPPNSARCFIFAAARHGRSVPRHGTATQPAPVRAIERHEKPHRQPEAERDQRQNQMQNVICA